MAADDADCRHKAEHIGIEENSGESVFIKREPYPVKILIAPLKVHAEHQADKAEGVKDGRGYRYKIRQGVQLLLEIKIGLGVHSVKDKEADEHM